MIAIIYRFVVKEGCLDAFLEAWKEMTEFIHQYEMGLGSRLHKSEEHIYIAYAQWPDWETWKNSGNQLPQEAVLIREKMRASCEKIERLYEMEVVEDLLKTSP